MLDLPVTLSIGLEQYRVARALRAVGEAEGDPELLEKAAAEFHDLGMYAAAERCRDRARHYLELDGEEKCSGG
jgi:hypothetical protein